MIGVGLALLLIGIVFLFIIPWVGIPVGIVGLALAAPWPAAFGRRAARDTETSDPRIQPRAVLRVRRGR